MKQAKRMLTLLFVLCLVLTLGITRAEAAEIDSYPVIELDTKVTVTIENGGDKAYFRFVPEYTESYTFTAFSGSDTFGHLYDSEMNQLKGNDDSGEGSNFAVTYTLEAGKTYVFAARFYSNTATGSFDVLLKANHEGEGEVITPATCTEDGVMGYTCTVCGQSYTEAIPATGHSYESVETVAPTCTEPGEMTHTCTVCGDVSKEEIPALGHSYDEGVVTTPHTCTEDGVKTFTCTVCGHSYTKAIPAAHTLAEDGTGCDICGVGCTASGDCGTKGSNLTWALYKDGALVISGIGKMYDASDNTQKWKSYWDAISSVVFEDGVTSVGDYAFYNCSSLTSIDLSNGVTSIGNYAFSGCSSLTGIEIPDSVTSIRGSAFKNCSSLTAIDIPGGVTSIFSNTFYGCSSLTSIDLPAGINTLDQSAFSHCIDLTRITFAGDAPTMHLTTFYGVTATVYYPAGNGTWTADRIDSLKDLFRNICTLTWVPYYNVFEDGTDTEVDSGEEAVIHIDADHTKLLNVYMDGELVDPSNYTVTAGSTVITFKASYLARLRGGEHEIKAEFEGGVVAFATITTTGPAYLPGDITGDGKVNNRDAARLMQYLAGWDVEFVEAALDVNGDGKVNNRDAARLMQYLAGWDVEIN